MVFKGKGGGQSSSKEYKRGTIENEGGGIRILQTCGGRVNFLVNFIPTQSKSFKNPPPLPPSVNDDQFPKHVFFLILCHSLRDVTIHRKLRTHWRVCVWYFCLVGVPSTIKLSSIPDHGSLYLFQRSFCAPSCCADYCLLYFFCL